METIKPAKFPIANTISKSYVELTSKSKLTQFFEARSPKNQRVYLEVTSKVTKMTSMRTFSRS